MAETEYKNKVKDSDTEAELERAKADSYMNLSADEKESLSLVLFPETHTDKVTIFNKERTLRPIPVKYAKQVHVLMLPLSKEIQSKGASKDPNVLSMNDTVLSALKAVAGILAEFYQWADVKVAVDDELLTLAELQQLAMTQAHLNGASDFLLGGLRVVIKIMQMSEMYHLKFTSLLTMRRSSAISTAPSMS